MESREPRAERRGENRRTGGMRIEETKGGRGAVESRLFWRIG